MMEAKALAEVPVTTSSTTIITSSSTSNTKALVEESPQKPNGSSQENDHAPDSATKGPIQFRKTEIKKVLTNLNLFL